jgi:hypothetical protein
MSLFRGSLPISAIAVGLSDPAFCATESRRGQPPDEGTVSTDDAGSGPTRRANPNTAEPKDAIENSAGVTPGPKSTGGAQPVTPITP